VPSVPPCDPTGARTAPAARPALRAPPASPHTSP
jgi:hypothetical protein